MSYLSEGQFVSTTAIEIVHDLPLSISGHVDFSENRTLVTGGCGA